MIDRGMCNEQIYKHGESYSVRADLTKKQTNEFCEKLTNGRKQATHNAIEKLFKVTECK